MALSRVVVLEWRKVGCKLFDGMEVFFALWWALLKSGQARAELISIRYFIGSVISLYR